MLGCRLSCTGLWSISHTPFHVDVHVCPVVDELGPFYSPLVPLSLLVSPVFLTPVASVPITSVHLCDFLFLGPVTVYKKRPNFHLGARVPLVFHTLLLEAIVHLELAEFLAGQGWFQPPLRVRGVYLMCTQGPTGKSWVSHQGYKLLASYPSTP